MRLRICAFLTLVCLVLPVFGQTAVELFPFETFDTWATPASPPAGWTRTMGGSETPATDNGNDWHPTSSPWGASWTTAPVANINYSPEEVANDWLITPVFNPTSAAFDSIVFVYETDYRPWGTSTIDNVIVLSTNNGTTWRETLAIYSDIYPAGVHHTRRINITSRVAGYTQCKIAFWYKNDTQYEYWWEVDNVCVYAYRSATEPEPPTFDFTCTPTLPMGTTSYTFTVNINDATGVNPSSVQFCYKLNTAPYNCVGMTYTTPPGSPPGTGTYNYVLSDLEPWDMISYYFRATDTYSPPQTGFSDTCDTKVLGPYYVYEDGTGFPMSPDTHWINPTTGFQITSLEADDAYTYLFGFPWSWVFYGVPYNTMYASSNGWFQFDGENPLSSFFIADTIPDPSSPQPLLAWCWGDNYGTYGDCYYYPDPAGNYFIIGFINWNQYPGTGPFWNCEVQIWRPSAIVTPGGNSVIDIRFQGLPGDLTDCEIGVETPDGLYGTEYLRTGNILRDPSYLGLTSPTRTIRFCTVPPPAGVLYGYVTLSGRTDHSDALVQILGTTKSDLSNATGFYRISNVPPGVYNVACTKLGFAGDTAIGVVIVANESTRVDFVLDPIPTGTVIGWANLADTPPPTDPGITCELLGLGLIDITDATGRFEFIDIPVGEYAVYATRAGYGPNASPLFELRAGETVYVDTIPLTREPLFFDFNATNGGFVPTPSVDGWEWGTPTAGPPSAYSPPKCWGTNLEGYYVDYADWWLVKDVSAYSDVIRSLSFYHWYNMESGFDGGNVSVSTDGGGIWELVYPDDGYDAVISTSFGSPVSGEPAYSGTTPSWQYESFDLSAYTGDITHIRFRFGADNSVSSYYGWYIDDVYMPVLPLPRGCVEGYVYDAETYTVLAGARVTCQGQMTYTNSSGYFRLCNVPCGYWQVYGAYPAYVANFKWAVVGNGSTTGPVFIPLERVIIDPDEDPGLVDDLLYGGPDTAWITICNPYDHPVDVEIGGGAAIGGLLRGSTERENTPLIGQKLISKNKHQIFAMFGKGRGHNNEYRLGSAGLARSLSPMATGDIVDSIVYPTHIMDLPWGFGTIGFLAEWRYWTSAVFPGSWEVGVRNYEFDADGNFTGFAFEPAFAPPYDEWAADMTYDGVRMWQLNVGGTNALYAWHPSTGAVLYELTDPDAFWDATSQRGVAYDPAEDVFYLGGWNDGIIYKIKGLSWDEPGEIMQGWIVGDIAGVAFHTGRRTVWVALNNAQNQIIEFDPGTGLVLNVLEYGWMGSYALAGMEMDALGRLWVVSMNQERAYAIQVPGGQMPVGIAIAPTSVTIPPNECVTIVVFTSGNAAPGTYSFQIPITFEGGYTFYYPVHITVSPELYAGWNLVSFPVNPTPNNVYVQLSDDIVPFSNDPPNSQIYAWDPVSGMRTTPDIFQRGRGYYLWSWYDDRMFDVAGTPYYTPMTLTLPYYASAALPGWNLVGNPVNTIVDWDAIVSDPAFTGIYRTYYTLTKWGWATYSPGFPGGADRYIEPYVGFFVLVMPGMTGVLPFGNFSIAHPLMKEFEALDGSSLPDFTTRLSVSNQGKIDMWNYMATRAGAFDGYDAAYDALVPPGVPGFTDLAYFSIGSNRLLRDVKQTMSNGNVKTWTIVVSGAVSGTPVTISWPLNHVPDAEDGAMGMNQIYAGYAFDLYDPITNIHTNMRSTGSYTFTFTGTRTLTVTVSATYLEAEENKVPRTFALYQNTPNPFNASTEISFYLPTGADVSLEIFDINGTRVKTLLNNNLSAGAYRITWNGDDHKGNTVASGIYFYRLTAGDFVESRRMVIVK